MARTAWLFRNNVPAVGFTLIITFFVAQAQQVPEDGVDALVQEAPEMHLEQSGQCQDKRPQICGELVHQLHDFSCTRHMAVNNVWDTIAHYCFKSCCDCKAAHCPGISGEVTEMDAKSSEKKKKVAEKRSKKGGDAWEKNAKEMDKKQAGNVKAEKAEKALREKVKKGGVETLAKEKAAKKDKKFEKALKEKVKKGNKEAMVKEAQRKVRLKERAKKEKAFKAQEDAAKKKLLAAEKKAKEKRQKVFDKVEKKVKEQDGKSSEKKKKVAEKRFKHVVITSEDMEKVKKGELGDKALRRREQRLKARKREAILKATLEARNKKEYFNKKLAGIHSIGDDIRIVKGPHGNIHRVIDTSAKTHS